jgi:hypothetical protein
MNVRKEAARDAHELARATMFYGEGAGTRRKLISATVEQKYSQDPTYARAFDQALNNEDMAEHAAKARKERRQLDRNTSLSKNVRGIMTGNKQGVNTGVLVAMAVAYYAHQTGYDKKIYEAGRTRYLKIKHKIQARNVVNNISSL